MDQIVTIKIIYLNFYTCSEFYLLGSHPQYYKVSRNNYWTLAGTTISTRVPYQNWLRGGLGFLNLQKYYQLSFLNTMPKPMCLYSCPSRLLKGLLCRTPSPSTPYWYGATSNTQVHSSPLICLYCPSLETLFSGWENLGAFPHLVDLELTDMRSLLTLCGPKSFSLHSDCKLPKAGLFACQTFYSVFDPIANYRDIHDVLWKTLP